MLTRHSVLPGVQTRSEELVMAVWRCGLSSGLNTVQMVSVLACYSIVTTLWCPALQQLMTDDAAA